MKRASILFISFCFFTTTLSAQQSFGRLIICADDFKDDPFDISTFRVMHREALFSLREQSSPVIMPEHIAAKILSAKSSVGSRFATDQTLQKLNRFFSSLARSPRRFKQFNQALKKDIGRFLWRPYQYKIRTTNQDVRRLYTLIGSPGKEKTERTTGLRILNEYFLHFTSLDRSNWLILHDPASSYVIFIPKSYIKSRLDKSRVQPVMQLKYRLEDEKRLGIKLSALQLYSLASSEQVIEFEDFSQPHLFTFIQKALLPIDAYQGMVPVSFNVFMIGHGAHQQVSGVQLDDMIQLIDYFDTKLTTKHFHYLSCFGPLYKIRGMKDGYPKRYNMILSAGTVIDAPITISTHDYHLERYSKDTIVQKDYRKRSSFFAALERGNVPIDKALSYVTYLLAFKHELTGAGNVPMVLVPGFDWERVVDVSPLFKRLTQVTDTAALVDNRDIMIQPGVRVILVSPQHVKAPVVIAPYQLDTSHLIGAVQHPEHFEQRLPRFVITHRDQAGQLFETIKVHGNLMQCIVQSFLTAPDSTEKSTTLIQKLSGGNDIIPELIAYASDKNIQEALRKHARRNRVMLTHVTMHLQPLTQRNAKVHVRGVFDDKFFIDFIGEMLLDGTLLQDSFSVRASTGKYKTEFDKLANQIHKRAMSGSELTRVSPDAWKAMGKVMARKKKDIRKGPITDKLVAYKYRRAVKRHKAVSALGLTASAVAIYRVVKHLRK